MKTLWGSGLQGLGEQVESGGSEGGFQGSAWGGAGGGAREGPLPWGGGVGSPGWHTHMKAW